MEISLGIDIGTTKSAAVLLEGRRLLAVESLPHESETSKGVQDVAKHIETVKILLARLPNDLKQRVTSVGVTGQMHGVVCWNETEVSPLYTWQSRVGDVTACQKICAELREGFGLVTLAWLADDDKLQRSTSKVPSIPKTHNELGSTQKYTHCGTIHDYFVWLITGKPEKVLMDCADATSWGGFWGDSTGEGFDENIVTALGIPMQILPKVVPCGALAGRLAGEWGLPEGIPVTVATGDNQASVFATSHNAAEEIHLTIGTGAQLSAVVDTETAESLRGKVELRPFFDEQMLAVVAPLCGGAAWAWLHEAVKNFSATADCTPCRDAELYDRIDTLALAEMEADDLPAVAPHFLGERHAPHLHGSIGALTLQNFTLGKLAAGLAHGIVATLAEPMPREVFATRTHLLASGNAIRKTAALRQAAEMRFGLPVEIVEGREEAACGAALLAMRHSA